MGRRPAMMWTCLLGACLVSVLPALTLVTRRGPQLLSCVFQQRANITCHWDPGDTQSFNTTSYTLLIKKMRPQGNNSSLEVLDTFSCSSSNTSCTVNINNSNIAFTFCITVTADFPHRHPEKSERCQSGRKEVKLSPVNLSTVEPVSGRPRCLMLTWVCPLSYAASKPEIKGGNLTSQIEVTSEEQPGVQKSEVRDVKVLADSFEVCLFRPYTSYSIRLRHHFHGSTAPWSEWSNSKEGRTGEDTPSAAPAFWRQVKETIKNRWRRVLLLWKPLPRFQANGEVLFYNVTCRSENAPILNDGGSCRDLNAARNSCSLLLSPESCTCLLTASNSAGTSTEAQIWLPGVSETELPPPNHVTANPLDDNRVEVRWTAPADQAVSGFVVEWFAVTESKSLRWDRVSSSCTAVVITEGVKPMERYAISVKALYDERGTGQSRLLYIYTRQGAPTAGPKLEVQSSANRAELSWNPIPVEKQRGYIRNYTLYYTAANEPPRKVYVPGDATRYSLQNLLPGSYEFYMKANTDAGTGVEGPKHNAYIGPEEVSLVMIVVKCAVLPFILTSLGLVLMACLAQNEMVKQKLCQDIPDPSHSSLAHWTPKTPLENGKWKPMAEKPKIQYSEITFAGESELQNMGQDFGYHPACIPQTYHSHPYSSLPYVGAQNPHHTRGCEREHIKSPLKTPVKTSITSTAGHDSPTATLTSSCCVYSHILPSQSPPTLPQPLLSYSQLQPSDWQYVTASGHDSKPQPGGVSELPASMQGKTTGGSDSPLSETDRLEINPLTVAEKTGLTLPSALQSLSLRYYNPLSRNVHNVSHSSSSLPHSAEVSSPPLFFSPGHINSAPSLRPDPFSYPISLSNSFSTSLSPFHHPIPVDLSYSLLSGQFSVDCDPYISSGV